eukprot:Skav233553  [mRNA]  locus=scaffold563:328180:331019:- [translate_table: standard]
MYTPGEDELDKDPSPDSSVVEAASSKIGTLPGPTRGAGGSGLSKAFSAAKSGTTPAFSSFPTAQSRLRRTGSA